MELLVIVLMAIGIILFFVAHSARQQLKRVRLDLGFYQTQYRTLQGYSRGYGNYHLCSFDSGEHWYTCERTDGGVKVLGEADPKLLAHIRAFKSLTDHVNQHGPLDVTNLQDLALLNKAGFTVTRHDDTHPAS